MSERAAIVVLPTYNEIDNIRPCLEALMACPSRVEVLVVDDASPDGTGQLAGRIAGEHSGRIHVLHRNAKAGLGAAYAAGLSWALDDGYTVIAQMDADGSHPAERLPAMLDLVSSGRADLVIGSRYIAGGATRDWPWRRRLMSRAANLYARTMLGLPQRDVTGAFRVWSAPALRAVDPTTMTASGYGFLFEMAHEAQRHGLVVAELPIVFVDRARGESKMTSSVAAQGALLVWHLRRQASQGARRPITTAAAAA